MYHFMVGAIFFYYYFCMSFSACAEPHSVAKKSHEFIRSSNLTFLVNVVYYDKRNMNSHIIAVH